MHPFVDSVVESARRNYPSFWNYCCPRFYQNTDAYLAAKVPASMFFMIGIDAFVLSKLTGVEPSKTEMSATLVLEKARRYQMPHLYVGPDLYAAVLQSKPPDQILWTEMNLPFEAGIFMLPRKTLFHPLHGEVAFLAYARHHKNEQVDINIAGEKEKFYIADESFTIVWYAHEDPTTPAFDVVMTDQAPHVSMNDIEECLAWERNDSSPLAVPVTKSETEFSGLATSIVFRLLLVMDAEPSLLERGQKTGKRLKTGPEIWTPNFVGRHYRVQRTGVRTAEGGWTVRFHWKKGHLKQQPYGPGSSFRKTVWIKPYHVGIKEQDLESKEAATTK